MKERLINLFGENNLEKIKNAHKFFVSIFSAAASKAAVSKRKEKNENFNNEIS